MNKKILSLAVAAAVAVPMAAQAADVTVSGALNMAVYNTNENLSGTGGSASGGLTGGDHGTNKIEVNVKGDNMFAKMAWDMRPTNNYRLDNDARENYLGIKVGGVNVSLGRHANHYNAGVKIDAMHATFLESRGRAGGVGKVASFVSGQLDVAGSAGDVKWAVAYAPANQDTYGFKNTINANVNFKAGPASVGVGYDQDTAGNTSTGLSAAMKFGDFGVKASFENVDGAAVSGCAAGTACTVIFADLSMPLGGGTIGLGLGSNTTASTTFSRVSYATKVSGATVYAGVSNDGASNQRAGVGMKIGF